MKILKTAKYKKISNSYKKELALKILDWHGGQWSYLYSVGSSWLAEHDVPVENIAGAISELDDTLIQMKQSVKNMVSSPEEWEEFENNINEIEQLKKSLREEMTKEELFDNKEDINLNLIDNY